MYTPNAKRIRLEGPVFKTQMTFGRAGDGNQLTSTPTHCQIPVQIDVGPSHEQEGAALADESFARDRSTSASASNPCTAVEYISLKQELEERNSQRDELIFKIKNLTEHNKKYKERLEKKESNKQQLQVLQKTHATQLADRDRLLVTLQDIIHDHEKKIAQYEEHVQGNIKARDTCPTNDSSPLDNANSSLVFSPSHLSSSARRVTDAVMAHSTTRLVADIQLLQDEKAELTLKLSQAQVEMDHFKAKYGEFIAELQKSISNAEKENKELRSQLQQANKENFHQTSFMDSSNCSTDTEKQLEKVQSENQRLTSEVSSLHRFYAHTSPVGFSLQTEELRHLQDENERLSSSLTSAQSLLQKKRAAWLEQESTLQAEISSLQAEKQQIARQLRDLQAKWTLLQARDPDVITRISNVPVVVESEELKSRFQSAQDQIAFLEQQIQEWEKRYSDRDHFALSMQRQREELNNKLEKSIEEKTHLQECLLEEVEKERENKELAVLDVRNEMEKKMYDLQVEKQQIRLRLSHLHSNFIGVQQSYQLLARQAKQFPVMVASVIKGLTDELLLTIQNIMKENKDLIRKYHREMQLRKRYHNELVVLKGNIRVFCRVRPPIKEDGTGSQADIVVSFDPDDDSLIYVSNKGRIQMFDFDRVFSHTSTQSMVFEEVRALVTSCIDGFNVCIFAYGQTGSGKTHTMEGPNDDPGINQRALQELFQETADKGEDWQFSIEVSVLEIYNETIRDLLSGDHSSKLDVKMKHEGGGYHVPGLHTVTVTSLQDVNQVFSIGRKNRATATTNMNEHSSRSHCLLSITITGVNRTTNTSTIGRLNLVDLAGSERVSKSGADGTRLKEAQNINKSLACLGDVIHALRVKQSHIPYRNSKLTYLLQDSLGGDSKTLMIVQVAPVEKNVSETTCSLSFGQRVRNVELGMASSKMDLFDAEAKSPSSTLAVSTPPVKKVLPKSPSTRSTPSKNSPTTSVRASPRSTRQTPLRK